uniref:Uncharacterized protein LOC101304959 n=1 Tax=Rhizophora mucronata TaxID=61149 RepID=A0A2P2LD63_RHIMU
MVLLERGNG